MNKRWTISAKNGKLVPHDEWLVALRRNGPRQIDKVVNRTGERMRHFPARRDSSVYCVR